MFKTLAGIVVGMAFQATSCAGPGSLTDLAGWDLSACDGNLDVCIELFTDNTDQLLGGASIIDVVLGGLGG